MAFQRCHHRLIWMHVVHDECSLFGTTYECLGSKWSVRTMLVRLTNGDWQDISAAREFSVVGCFRIVDEYGGSQLARGSPY